MVIGMMTNTLLTMNADPPNSKQPAKPKVKVGIREYRKDHWQLTFSYEGKQVHLQKWIDGTPLTAKPMAVALKGICNPINNLT